MPLDGAVVYAKWAPKSFTVTFNSDGGTKVPTQTVVGGELVADFDDTTRDEYEFLGWYEAGSDTPFDFKMPITRDVNLTAKWEKVTIIDYTVNYYKTGTTEPVFATEQLRGYVGQEVNIMSKTHETLIADHVSQTITLSWKAEDNVITFYYSEPHDIYYKVQYIDAVTGSALKAEEVHTTRNTNAAASYIKIDGYEVNSTRQIITLDDEASEGAIKNNIITFYYKPIIEVAVKGNTCTFVYDGTEKTVSGSAATCQKVAGQTATEMPDGVTIDLAAGQAAQAQGTAAGTYNMGLSKDSFVAQFAESSSYTSENCVVRIVKVEDGWLKITEQTIVPPTDPDTDPEYKGVTVGQLGNEIYDGKEYKKVPEVKDGSGTSLVEGRDFEVSYTHSDDKENFTDVQTITVTIKGIGNYTGTVTRTYQITPATLTVTTPSAEKVYDGTALTKTDGAKVEGLVKEEKVTFTVTGTQTDVGYSTNTYEIKFVGEAGADEATTAQRSNYKIIEEKLGTLTVKNSEEEIVVTTTGGTFTYDGKAHGATVTVGTLPKGYTVKTAESTAKATHVSEGKVTATADNLVIVNAKDEDVTAQLKITKVDGEIEITPAPLAVTTPDASKVYDGTALTKEGTITGFVNEETADFATTGTQTDVGNSKNTYTLVFAEEEGASDKATAVRSDYNVSETVGTLTVTKQSIDPDEPDDPDAYKDITIDSPIDVPYDGDAHQWAPTVKDKDGNTLTVGTDYTVDYSTTDFTNVTGLITVTIKGNGNYTGTVTRTYKITPATLTVTTPSAEKVYDGTALTKTDGAKVEGLVKEEKVTFTVTGTQTDVGYSTNTYEIKFVGEDGAAETTTAQRSNYKIIEENLGTLTVKVQKIDPGPDPENPDPEYGGVEINDPDDVTYDGEEHKFVPEVTDKDGNPLVEGKDYEVTYDVDNFTDVTKVTVTITGKGNYQGEVVKKYEITKRAIEITAGSASKTYDGTALTEDSYEVTSGSEAATDEITSVTVTGSITNVGTEENIASEAVIMRGEVDATGNYAITYLPGTLKVTAQKIDPGPDPENPDPEYSGVEINDPDDVTYDGEEHKFVPEVTDKDGNPLVEGEDYIVTYDTDNFTDVTKVTVIITGNGNYDGEIIKTYEIKPAKVTITTDSASKTYDGTALTAGGRIEGLVNGEEVSFKAIGSQTSVGTSENTYSLVWDKTAKEGNYTIDKVTLGTLTVTQAPEPETPSQDGGNTNNRDHTAPRTGDDTMNTVLLLMLIMILAGAGLGTAAYAYKKRK